MLEPSSLDQGLPWLDSLLFVCEMLLDYIVYFSYGFIIFYRMYFLHIPMDFS